MTPLPHLHRFSLAKRLIQYRITQRTIMLTRSNSTVNRLESSLDETQLPADQQARHPYWQNVAQWKDVAVCNTIERPDKLLQFLLSALPAKVQGTDSRRTTQTLNVRSREDFIADVKEGMKVAPMDVRLTPHILSVIDWTDPVNDSIRKQFMPLGSTVVKDHPKLSLDSLHEIDDSAVPGLVHRYPDKVLFFATSVCPVYCRFCTRSYAVGGNTESVTKHSMKPTRKRWDAMLEFIENNPAIQDVVISGGDSYYLQPDHLALIGERLLSIPNIKWFRFATKGLAVCPSRILDTSDGWTQAFISLTTKGRLLGKQIAMHTHFNHPNEITWVTELAARHLFENGVTVRNQTVLLRGVNDEFQVMSTLIRKLADLNVTPYYVYQSDMVSGVEDLRTPLSTILELERKIRGTIAGFMTPSFVADLLGGGKKRLATSFETYEKVSGVSAWQAPGVTGDKTFYYYDPVQHGESPA